MADVDTALANIARIEDALAQNVLEVTFADGRMVRFSTFDELIQRLEFWRVQAGQTAGRQRMLGEFTKGVTR